MPRAIVLVATIPSRKFSCQRLLAELEQQTRRPDGVILRLDGYGQEPAPFSPFPIVRQQSTYERGGPGQRWILAHDHWLSLRGNGHDADFIVINLDDDMFTRKAPRLIEALVAGVEEHGAAAAMGRTPDGGRAAPSKTSRGRLIYGAGCALALRAEHLSGLGELRDRVIAAGGRDPLGPCGDDDALVSALLWSKGIAIHHAATGVINSAAGTQTDSQTRQRMALREELDEQKRLIARLTGWPWPTTAKQ